MKSATLPMLRVTPEFRAATESVLDEGETLSAFVEEAVRRQVDYRRTRQEFIARGLAAREQSQRTGIYHSHDDVMDSLREILETAEQRER